MSDVEALRSALFQLEHVRAREAAARRRSSALFKVLDALTAAPTRPAALEGLVAAMQAGLGCSAVGLARVAGPGGGLRFVHATDAALGGLVWAEGGWALSEARTLANMLEAVWPQTLPAAFSCYRALLVAPFDAGEGPEVLVCLDRRVGAFRTDDLSLMRQLAVLTAQTLRARDEAQRNALLTALLDAPVEKPSSAADIAPESANAPAPKAPEPHFERALNRLTRAQMLAGELITRLLDADPAEIAQVVEATLEQMGRCCGSDRVSVVCLGDDGPMMLRCEWCAPEARASAFSDLGFDEATRQDWAARFRHEGAVYVHDAQSELSAPLRQARFGSDRVQTFLAVPILQEGQVAGFLAHAFERRQARFLPGEMHMMRSVASVMGAVIERRAALREVARVQGALAHSKQQADSARTRLAGAVASLPDGFAFFDAEERLVLHNAAFERLFPPGVQIRPGMTMAEVLDAGIAAGAFAEAQRNAPAWRARRMQLYRMGDSDTEVQMADGRWLRVIEKSLPESGKVVLWLDVTDLKQTARRALADRAAAMDASSDGIAVLDGTGRFTYLNAAMRAMLGLPHAAPLVGRPFHRVLTRALSRHLRRRVMPELAGQGLWRGEIAVDGGARGPRVLELSLSARDGLDGGVLAICRDVTERRRDFATQVRLREELQLAQRREIVFQIAAGLAHDFNNLLAAISGSAALILRSGAPEAAPHAERIVSAVSQAGALIERLTELGTRRPALVMLDLRDQVCAAADLLRADLGENIELVLDLPEAPVSVEADPGDILQVVLNLAVNARDAVQDTAAGPGPHRIVIALAPTAPAAPELAERIAAGHIEPGRAYARLSVSDTGPGIAEEARARMFEPYFTTKCDRGTGLGLSIVSGVIGATGGAIAVTSTPGAGARFDVFWPSRAPRPAEAAPTPKPRPAPPQPGEAPLEGKLILLVDDNTDVLEILAAFLEQAGAEVASCTDPRDALEGLSEDPDAWDLLITDYDMAPLNGAELVSAARSIVPDLPILLVTALPDWRGRAGGPNGRFFDVLGKPVTQERLVAAALNALGRSST